METIRKYSKKRQAILEALRETRTHPTAEWLYARLKPEYPDLSMGTVYRNLSLFKAEGTITSVGVVNGQERFDADTSPHAHFICSTCGRVEDMVLPQPDAEHFAQLCADGGRQMEGYSLTVTGKCSSCVSKK